MVKCESTIKYESMLDLVKMFDTQKQVGEVLTLLTGKNYVCGLDDGVFGNLTRTFDIIYRECDQSLVVKGLDLEEQEIFKIMYSAEKSQEEKALLLCGMDVCSLC